MYSTRKDACGPVNELHAGAEREHVVELVGFVHRNVACRDDESKIDGEAGCTRHRGSAPIRTPSGEKRRGVGVLPSVERVETERPDPPPVGTLPTGSWVTETTRTGVCDVM